MGASKRSRRAGRGAFLVAAGIAGASAGALLFTLAVPLAGCGSDDVPVPPLDGGADGDAPGPTIVTLHPDAAALPGESSCEVVITTGIPVPSYKHVELCTDVSYATNPPSSGSHWGIWAAYKSFSVEVPREMYVHNLEHGAVVLAHRCSGECPEVVDALEQVRTSATTDPKCAVYAVNARVLVTPDPELDHPIAAAGWGSTYVATCLDQASLEAFVKAAYGRGPEAVCAPGRDLEDPDAAPPCF
jgi:hypothetical protein